MRPYALALLFQCSILVVRGQSDSSIFIMDDSVPSNLIENIPVQQLDPTESGLENTFSTATVLYAGNDVLANMSSFNFSFMRYRSRGYDNMENRLVVNGLNFTDLETNTPAYSLFGGLNDFFRNREWVLGIRDNNFTFGKLGTQTSLNTSNLFSQDRTILSYAFSNRNYRHKFSLMKILPISQTMTLTIGGGLRYSNEGYVPGTYYDSKSYFLGLEKQLGKNQRLGLNIFGQQLETGRQLASVLEAKVLAGDTYYNPAWGWQNGKKRNANIGTQHIPVVILWHDIAFSVRSSLHTAVSFQKGHKGYTALEWQTAPDPRPDYYRYLPSYYQGTQKEELNTYFTQHPERLQIDWDNMYAVNKNNIDADGLTQSLYVLGNRKTETQRYLFASTFHTYWNERWALTAGIQFQKQKDHYYQQVEDLLGGDYWLNINQYVQRNFPYDVNVIQYDIDHPNKKVNDGENYGYNYTVHQLLASEWMQLVYKFKKWELFASGEITLKQSWRVGHQRNGLFPALSFGKSMEIDFLNFNIKNGITYKINNKNSFYVYLGLFHSPPRASALFISPKTRNSMIDNPSVEVQKSVEGGYHLHTEKIRLRLSGYLSHFDNGTDIKSFYDDYYNTFVNYSIRNIDRIHYGGELSATYNVSEKIQLNIGSGIGQYYYSSRQNAVVTSDNQSEILSESVIFSKNLHVPSTPSTVVGTGVNFKPKTNWTVALNASMLRDMWLSINPLRRTITAVEDINPLTHQEVINQIIGQTRIPSAFMTDLFSAYYWQLKHKKTISVFLSVNNLLNNRKILSGGYEQLRFDFSDFNTEKFPPKYFYAQGINYYLQIAYRF